jgi:hypothetical protein
VSLGRNTSNPGPQATQNVGRKKTAVTEGDGRVAVGQREGGVGGGEKSKGG